MRLYNEGLAHDGPPLSRGDDVTPEEMKEWVTIYVAGWGQLNPGSFLDVWRPTTAEDWGFDFASPMAPDFNSMPRTLLWR